MDPTQRQGSGKLPKRRDVKLTPKARVGMK